MFSDYAKKRNRDWEYEYLKTTPVLHSSQYLSELYDQAKTKQQRECILEHMNRHTAWEVESYRKIEQNFINKEWGK